MLSNPGILEVREEAPRPKGVGKGRDESTGKKRGIHMSGRGAVHGVLYERGPTLRMSARSGAGSTFEKCRARRPRQTWSSTGTS